MSIFAAAATFGHTARRIDKKYSDTIYTVAKRYFTLPPMYTVATTDGALLPEVLR